jgi:hypothetical protein
MSHRQSLHLLVAFLLLLGKLVHGFKAPCEWKECRSGKCEFFGCKDPVSCRGGACIYRECHSPTCEGGGCEFHSCYHPSCPGGACAFYDLETGLEKGYCLGGGCTIDGFEQEHDIGLAY